MNPGNWEGGVCRFLLGILLHPALIVFSMLVLDALLQPTRV